MEKKKTGKRVVRISKVYTRGGDKGQTSLVGGGRVPKDSLRVEAYGTVDETNSVIGLARCFNSQKPPAERRDKFELVLQTIQQRLFDLGSELATHPSAKGKRGSSVSEENVQWLEEVIDAMNEELKPLDSFILPGGGPVNAFLHQARTVCRRAERRIAALSRKEKVGPWVVPYINRLSDALFVFSRWTASTMGEAEYLWEPGKTDPADWRWS